MSKWIEFRHYSPKSGQKTSLWIVRSKQSGATLGVIKWFGSWRKYSFFPSDSTIFEQDCLRDIANFIEEKTKEYKIPVNKKEK